MEAWMKWMNENKASILEGGAPLGKTKRAVATGISDTKNNVGGYSIVQADTREAAAETVRQGPPTFKCRVPGWKFLRLCRYRGCDPMAISLL
jgi:hypothetical protein